MGDVGMYSGIAVGTVLLLGVCGGILYHKHQQDRKQHRAEEQIIQERFQHVADNNLPPFYIDHELDPVAVYEHELHPDTIPVAEPILVQSPAVDIILPEEDPLVTSPSFLRSLSASRMPSTISIVQTLEDIDSSTAPSSSTEPQHDAVADADGQDSVEGVVDSNVILGPASSQATEPSTTTIMQLASSSPNTPITEVELQTLAHLPPPPSYDVPNRIVDQSPMLELTSFNFSSSSTSTTAFERTGPPTNDYFNYRVRSQTFSHPTPAHYDSSSFSGEHRHQNLPETPRYSLEFPSHIPHEHHLQQYQQARAYSATCSIGGTPTSSVATTPRFGSPSPSPSPSPSSHMYHLQNWSFSGTSTENESLSIGGRHHRHHQRRPNGAGTRARASTLGDSSKLLVQRMQSLWRKSTTAAAAATSGSGSGSATGFMGASPMSSSEQTTSHQDLPRHGLGLSLDNDQDQNSSAQDEMVVVVVVAPEQEEEENEDLVEVPSSSVAREVSPTVPTSPLLVPTSSSSASTLSPDELDNNNDNKSSESIDDDDDDAAAADMSLTLSLESDRMPISHLPFPLAVS
ncbi:hypothetical protein BG004_005405 [Podila humilis]|nr:hypothetical protein BG004_005405 [Podila humilis]